MPSTEYLTFNILMIVGVNFTLKLKHLAFGGNIVNTVILPVIVSLGWAHHKVLLIFHVKPFNSTFPDVKPLAWFFVLFINFLVDYSHYSIILPSYNTWKAPAPHKNQLRRKFNENIILEMWNNWVYKQKPFKASLMYNFY